MEFNGGITRSICDCYSKINCEIDEYGSFICNCKVCRQHDFHSCQYSMINGVDILLRNSKEKLIDVYPLLPSEFIVDQRLFEIGYKEYGTIKAIDYQYKSQRYYTSFTNINEQFTFKTDNIDEFVAFFIDFLDIMHFILPGDTKPARMIPFTPSFS